MAARVADRSSLYIGIAADCRWVRRGWGRDPRNGRRSPVVMIVISCWVMVCSRCEVESGPPAGSVAGAVCGAEQAGWLTALGIELCPACVCAGVGDEVLRASVQLGRTACSEAA